MLASSRRVSPLAASFVGSLPLGIHHTPFVAYSISQTHAGAGVKDPPPALKVFVIVHCIIRSRPSSRRGEGTSFSKDAAF
jgi:hypothetical protein